MNRIDRYIAKTVWLSILLVLFAILGIDVLSAFIDEADNLGDGYGFRDVSYYIAMTVPRRCYEYIPFAALIGSLVGLGQLASSSELVVMRAAGISNLRLAWTVLQQALLLAMLGFLLGEYVAPIADQRAQSYRALALYADRQLTADKGIWRRDGRLFLHVQALAADDQIYGVTVYDFAKDGWLRRAFVAENGRYLEGQGWSLTDVKISEFSQQSIKRDVQPALLLPSNVTPRILALENVSPSQLALSDLLRYRHFLEAQGEATADFELASWRKLIQPAAIAALVLVAVSFVFGPLRDGTLGFRIFAGVMVGILFRLSQDLLGPASLVFGFPPFYAAVVPVVLCIAVGVLLLRRA